jgi:transposase
MEACATAHYWARELTKLGHKVRLMPARDVKAYVKRNKNDAADAEAICEAVRRPTMRFLQVKSAEQQSQLMLHQQRPGDARHLVGKSVAASADRASDAIALPRNVGHFKLCGALSIALVLLRR